MRSPISTLGLVALLAVPATARAQPIDEVMSSIRAGGGWVSIDIENGRGSASTVMLPTMGFTLTGCARVWDGHSGHWDIRVHDTVADETLEVSSDPGEGVSFTHTFGLRSQLDVEIAWSEPRDTTLLLWVGLGEKTDTRDPCVPPPSG